MFKSMLNRIDIYLTLELKGPLLVKERSYDEGDAEGKAMHEKRRSEYKEPDMLFVRIARTGSSGGTRLEPFIPGSSIKGLLRCHAERITRTLNAAGCCDPFGDKGNLWGQGVHTSPSFSALLKSTLLKENQGLKNAVGPDVYKGMNLRMPLLCISGKLKNAVGPDVYKGSCPICRVFGNAFLRSRLQVDDAYLEEGPIEVPQPPGPLEGKVGDTTPWWWSKAAWKAPYSEGRARYLGMRTSVAIDRFTGGALEGALFDYECMREGSLKTRLSLSNYELWQLGLLAFLLRDMEHGRLRIGYGKNRGLGSFLCRVDEVRIIYFGRCIPQRNVFWGIGEMIPEEEAIKYGVQRPDEIVVKDLSRGNAGPDGFYYSKTYYYKPDEFKKVWEETSSLWVEMVKPQLGQG